MNRGHIIKSFILFKPYLLNASINLINIGDLYQNDHADQLYDSFFYKRINHRASSNSEDVLNDIRNWIETNA